MTPYKIYITLAAIFVLIAAVILAVNPSYADFLFKDYGIIEYSAVAIAGLSMVLALILGVLGRRKGEVWRFWFLLAFLSFLFMGESLSWGERFFNIKMPVIAGIKFDALHDAFSVSIGIIKKTRDFIIRIGAAEPKSIAIIISTITASSLFLYFAAGLIVSRKKEIERFFRVNLRKPPFLFLFAALVLIIMALIIDDDNLVGFPHKEVADEGLELLAVLAMLFSSVCGFLGKKWGFAKSGTL